MRSLRIYLGILFTLFSSVVFAVNDSISYNAVSGQDSLIKYVIIHDTVYVEGKSKKVDHSDKLLRTKPVGRYDRGISNYRFIAKNRWIGGVTFSMYNFENENGRLLYSLIKDVDVNLRYSAVNPFVGYAVSDNNILGLKLGYSRLSGNLNNFSLNVVDMDISLKDLQYTSDSYSCSIFHRSYIGLDPGGVFGLFNETSLGYVSGSSKFSTGNGDNLKYTDTTLHKLHLGINPGIAIFIMPNVGAELSFGVAGFSYNWEKQKKSSGEEGKRTSSGANFKINILNINIGLTVCI